jgi:chemotaxis protein methyltransferase CheR
MLVSDIETVNDIEKVEIELLLEAIYRHCGFDFRSYSFPSIRRRIWHRVYTEQLSSISSLQEKILHNPHIMKKLVEDFSINVTELFRDPRFFLTFRKQVIPMLRTFPDIRIWHAGCSTGEEVYSMSILLHEAGLHKKTRIYATDMNETVLATAKQGKFPLDKMQLYTNNYVKSGGTKAFCEYYTVVDNDVLFHPFLRENIVFAQHNLATDYSFNEFHVILCRNVMIYFNNTLQNRVLNLFYESLKQEGILGLGAKENIAFTNHAACYEEIDVHEKLYRKVK